VFCSPHFCCQPTHACPPSLLVQQALPKRFFYRGTQNRKENKNKKPHQLHSWDCSFVKTDWETRFCRRGVSWLVTPCSVPCVPMFQSILLPPSPGCSFVYRDDGGTGILCNVSTRLSDWTVSQAKREQVTVWIKGCDAVPQQMTVYQRQKYAMEVSRSGGKLLLFLILSLNAPT